MTALLSTLGGFLVWKRRVAKRREFLQGAAQYLGLQYLEGDAAWQQAQRDQGLEGLPEMPVPEFLQRLARKLVSPRLSAQFRGAQVAVYEAVHSSRSGSHTESVFKAYFTRLKGVLVALAAVAAAFAG